MAFPGGDTTEANIGWFGLQDDIKKSTGGDKVYLENAAWNMKRKCQVS